MVPNFPPSLNTFAAPKPGLCDFTRPWNRLIRTGYRVVNCLDLVPCLPFWPYEQVGGEVHVNSGGSIDPLWRHSLFAYRDGIQRLVH
jgi:hypothetical protein